MPYFFITKFLNYSVNRNNEIPQGGLKMKIGIIGAGDVGLTLANLWIQAGHQVFLSSRHPKSWLT